LKSVGLPYGLQDSEGASGRSPGAGTTGLMQVLDDLCCLCRLQPLHSAGGDSVCRDNGMLREDSRDRESHAVWQKIFDGRLMVDELQQPALVLQLF